MRGLIGESRGRPLAAGDPARRDPEAGKAAEAAQIHTDAAAAEAADFLSADAFTLGRDIFFAGGAYAPGAVRSGVLLAHELLHVQQSFAALPPGAPTPPVPPATPPVLSLAARAHALERAAERGDPGAGRAPAGLILRMPAHLPPTAGGQRLWRWLTPERGDDTWTRLYDHIARLEFADVDAMDSRPRAADEKLSDALTDPVTAALELAGNSLPTQIRDKVVGDFVSDLTVLVKEELDATEERDFLDFRNDIEAVSATYTNLVFLYVYEQQRPSTVSPYPAGLTDWFETRADVFRDAAVRTNSPDALYAVLSALAAEADAAASEDPEGPIQTARALIGGLFEDGISNDDTEAIAALYETVMKGLDPAAIENAEPGLGIDRLDSMRDEYVLDYLADALLDVERTLIGAGNLDRLTEFRQKMGDEIAYYLATVRTQDFHDATEVHLEEVDALLSEYGGPDFVQVFLLYVWVSDADLFDTDDTTDTADTATDRPAPEPTIAPPRTAPPTPEPEEEACTGESIGIAEIEAWLKLHRTNRAGFRERWRDVEGLMCANTYNPLISLAQAGANLSIMTDAADRFLGLVAAQVIAARERATQIDLARVRAQVGPDFIGPLALPVADDAEPGDPLPGPDYIDILDIDGTFYNLFHQALSSGPDRYGTEDAEERLGERMLGEFEALAYYQLSLKAAVELWTRLSDQGLADYMRQADPDTYTDPLAEMQALAENTDAWSSWPGFAGSADKGGQIDIAVLRLSGRADAAAIDMRLDTIESLQTVVFDAVPAAVTAFHADRARAVPKPPPVDFIRLSHIRKGYLEPRLPFGWQDYEDEVMAAAESALEFVNASNLAALAQVALEVTNAGDTIKSAGLIDRMVQLEHDISGHAKTRLGDRAEEEEMPADVDPLLQRLLGENLSSGLAVDLRAYNQSNTERLLGLFLMAEPAMNAAGGDLRGPGQVVRQANLLRLAMEDTSSKTLTDAFNMIDFIYEEMLALDPARTQQFLGDSMLGWTDDVSMWASSKVTLGARGMIGEASVQLQRSAVNGALSYMLRAEQAGGREERDAVLAELAYQLRQIGGAACIVTARFIYADILGVAHLVDELGMPPEVREAQTRINTAHTPMIMSEESEVVERYNDTKAQVFADLDRGVYPANGVLQNKGQPLTDQQRAVYAAYQEVTGDDSWHGIGEEDIAAAVEFFEQVAKMAAIMLVTRGIGAGVAARTGIQALGTVVELGTFTAAMRAQQTLSTGVYPHTSIYEDLAVNAISLGVARGTQIAYRGAFGLPQQAARIGAAHGVGIFVAELATTSVSSLAVAALSAKWHGRDFTDAEVRQTLISNAAFMVTFQGAHVLGRRATEYFDRHMARVALEGRLRSADPAALQAELARHDDAIHEASDRVLTRTTDAERAAILDEQLASMRAKLAVLERSADPEVRMLAASYRLGVEAHAHAVGQAKLHIQINAEPVPGTTNFTYSPDPISERALLKHLNESGATFAILRVGDGRKVFEVHLPDGRTMRYRPRRVTGGGGTREGAYTPVPRLEGNELTAGDPAPLMDILLGDPLIHPEVREGGSDVFIMGEGPFSIQIQIRPVERFSTDRVTHRSGPANYRLEFNRSTGMLEANIEVLTNASDDHMVRGVNHEMYEIARIVEQVKTATSDDITRISNDRSGTFLRGIVEHEAAASALKPTNRGTAVTADDLATMRSVGFLGERLRQLDERITAPETPIADLELLYQRRNLVLADFRRVWREFGLPTDPKAVENVVAQFAGAGVNLPPDVIAQLRGLHFTQRGDPNLGRPMDMLDLQIMFSELRQAMPKRFKGMTYADFIGYYQEAIARKALSAHASTLARTGNAAAAADAQADVIVNLIGGLSRPSARGRVYERVTIDAWNSNPDIVAVEGRMYGVRLNNFPTYDAVTVMGAPGGFSQRFVEHRPAGIPAGKRGPTKMQLVLPDGTVFFSLWRDPVTKQSRSWCKSGFEVQMWSVKARDSLEMSDVFKASGTGRSAKLRGRMATTEEGLAWFQNRISFYEGEIATARTNGWNGPSHASHGIYQRYQTHLRVLARVVKLGQFTGSNREIDAKLSVARAAGVDPDYE